MTSPTGPNAYYDSETIVREVSQKHHRQLIGGAWDEIGKLQFDVLRANGLATSSTLIDTGCGCLRGGVYFVDFLDAGKYYGLDISEDLLNVGYDIELHDRGLQHKLPRAHLVADGEFQFSKFAALFDFGIAQSLFSHLSTDYVRLCLSRLRPCMARNGKLFATFFLVPEDHPVGTLSNRPIGIQTFDHKDPYHFRFSQIEKLCEGLAWRPVLVGDWQHPRDQQMVLFHPL